jgi:hypothetical protein
MRHKLIAALVILSPMVLLVLVLVLLASGPSSLPPLPNPNGYDDLIKASAAAVGNAGDYPTLSRESLAGLVSTNAEALRLLRRGLTNQCLMPMDSALTNTAGMADQMACMKRLVQLLAAEGRLRELDGQPADAARSYTDAIRFGNELSRGGVLITYLTGLACEAVGGQPLAKVVPKLSPEQARVVLTALEGVDADRVTLADVLRNERYWVQHQNGTRLKFNPIIEAMNWWGMRQLKERAETRRGRIVAHERLLAVELALRCYRSEQGRAPARLDDLVTNYLARAPEDPFTGKLMIYRPQGTNWLMYSVGPDGVDNGGQSPADLFFDSKW